MGMQNWIVLANKHEEGARMKVLLLKEPRENQSGEDPYVQELAVYGHHATLIPVLAFQYVALSALSDKLFEPEKFGGIVFTSPRAVEAVKRSTETSTRKEKWNTVQDKWNQKSVYVVGKATASLAEDLGFICHGEQTGTAETLSQLIIQRENPALLPLLFPSGSLKREVLPTTLNKEGIPLETLTVYQTAEHPDLERNITHYFTDQGVPSSVAFFSPSGVKFCLDLLKKLAGEKLNQIKFVAIGPTTTEALQAAGVTVSGSAQKPTPQHLTTAITHALAEDL